MSVVHVIVRSDRQTEAGQVLRRRSIDSNCRYSKCRPPNQLLILSAQPCALLSRRVFLLSFAVSGRSGVEARRARLASTHVISARCKARRCQKRREMHIILDMQGRARRETARRRNSECKIDLSSRNSSRGNGSIGLQRSGDWLAARCSDQCAAPTANHRCAVGLLTAIVAREFRCT